MKILVTRPQPYAESLCEVLKKQQFEPILFPSLEIKPLPADTLPALEMLNNLNTAQFIIFTSRAAATFGMTLISKYSPQLPLVPIVAIGAGTQKTLSQLGIHEVITPEHPPFESEALLALPQFQILDNNTILLFKGKGGRPLLVETLKKRGAQVITFNCYERCLPRPDEQQFHHLTQQLPIHVTLTTSQEGLRNLVSLLGHQLWDNLKNHYLVVVGPRMQADAKRLGAQKIIVSPAADDATLLKIVQHIQAEIP